LNCIYIGQKGGFWVFQALEKQLESKLILPGNPLYDEKRKVWNGAIDKYPKAIAVCQSEKDVALAVQFAKKNHLHISIKGGGHHVAGIATCNDGLMIDISNMNKVTVDEEKKIAIVEGGATLGDVDSETQKHGLAVPTGTVSKTGIAGLALNGGLGYLRGKYGLTCDNIIGARIVTANVELIEVNNENYPDLLWAIRGGGGNFGVVTKFIFQLHPVGPEVLGLDIMYNYHDAKQILLKSQQYLNQAPDEVSFNIMLTQLPPVPFLPEVLHHKKVVILTGMYAGDPKQGEKMIQPLRELAKPIVDNTAVLPYVELQKKLDPMVPEQAPVYGTSLYFQDLLEEHIDTLIRLIDNAPAPTYIVQLWGLNGQINQVPADATAFAIRDAKYALLLDIMGMGIEEPICQQWIQHVYETLLPYSYKGASYLNGIGLSEKVTKSSFQENYQKLLEIKKKYDPYNLFRHNHNINPNE